MCIIYVQLYKFLKGFMYKVLGKVNTKDKLLGWDMNVDPIFLCGCYRHIFLEWRISDFLVSSNQHLQYIRIKQKIL